MPAKSSPDNNNQSANLIITPDLETATTSSPPQQNVEEQIQNYLSKNNKKTYRDHQRQLIADLLLEYVSQEDTSAYDFVADVRHELFSLQDYFQGQLNKVNAIISYLSGKNTPHLHTRKNVSYVKDVTDSPSDWEDFWNNEDGNAD